MASALSIINLYRVHRYLSSPPFSPEAISEKRETMLSKLILSARTSHSFLDLYIATEFTKTKEYVNNFPVFVDGDSLSRYIANFSCPVVDELGFQELFALCNLVKGH